MSRIELANSATRVVLEPALGGRVLSYAHDGIEALQRDAEQEKIVWNGSNVRHPAGGRFDVGPEYDGHAREQIWFGTWIAHALGPRSAQMTSPVMPDSGLQLGREFTLAAGSSHLRCTQWIHNRGARPLSIFHWGRTFVPTGGIAVAPLAAGGRFPRGYALGGPRGVIDYLPEPEPNVRVREGVLEILGPPRKAKFSFEVDPGWLAYLAPAGLLFIKTFSVFRDRRYGDLAAANASIWYGSCENTPRWLEQAFPVEIEPIGPLEMLAPGASAVFTEDWWLERWTFPEDRKIDLPCLSAAIERARSESAR